MKLGLVVNRSRPTALTFASELIVAAQRIGLDTVSDQPDGTWGDEPSDIIIAVGGDGTVLEAVQRGLESDTPVLGFNLGTVGFLAEVEPEELETVLEALAKGDYTCEDRPTLGARLEPGGFGVGINDVVIEKIESQRLVVLDVEIDGEPFLSYRSDGLVVATSTGSTAYAFSAGGPLVDPILDATLMIPVAPHSLFNRALVLGPDSRIRCRVATDRSVRVSVDGVELGTLHEGEEVEIARAATVARFVRVDGLAFPARVRRKLNLT